MTGRAYGRATESRYHQARIRAENEHRRAVANRCTRRPRSTVKNPLSHVWQGVGADVMGCKHCPQVRQLTNAEYRAKYGVDRPPPSRQQTSGGGMIVAVPIMVIVAVLVLILIHNSAQGSSAGLFHITGVMDTV